MRDDWLASLLFGGMAWQAVREHVERRRRGATGRSGPVGLAGRWRGRRRALRHVRAGVAGGGAAARAQRAGRRQEARGAAVDRAHPRRAQPPVALAAAEAAGRRQRQAEGAPGPGRRARRAGLQGLPVRGEQADGGHPAHGVGALRPPPLRPPPQRLLRRMRRHGLPRQQGEDRSEDTIYSTHLVLVHSTT